jgi:hypothetical protein
MSRPAAISRREGPVKVGRLSLKGGGGNGGGGGRVGGHRYHDDIGFGDGDDDVGRVDGIAKIRVVLPSYEEKVLHVQTTARVEYVKKMIRNNFGVIGGSLILNSVVCLDDHRMNGDGVYMFEGAETGELMWEHYI